MTLEPTNPRETQLRRLLAEVTDSAKAALPAPASLHLTSLTVVELHGRIEEAFDVRIRWVDCNRNTFDSVASLTALIDRLEATA